MSHPPSTVKENRLMRGFSLVDFNGVLTELRKNLNNAAVGVLGYLENNSRDKHSVPLTGD